MTNAREELDGIEVLANPESDDGIPWNPRLTVSGEANWNGKSFYPSVSLRVPLTAGPVNLELTGTQARALRDRLDAAIDLAESDVEGRCRNATFAKFPDDVKGVESDDEQA
jgi:hypothetical protein